MLNLKDLELTIGSSFEANGKKYTVSDSMSIDRFIMFEQIELEMGYGTSFAQIFDELNVIYGLMNRTNAKPMDAGVKLYNLIYGVRNLPKKKPYALRAAALFINYEGEDVRTITEQNIDEKIDDWNREGYKPDPFIQYGLSSLRGFLERYKKLIPDTSDQTESK